jgi:hypothetical protein
MYADAFSTITGTDAYHWCLSGDLLATTIQRIRGSHPFIKRTVVRQEGKTVLLHSVASVSTAEWKDQALSADLMFPAGLPHRVLLVGLGQAPQTVRVGDKQIARLSEEPLIEEGWIWEDELGLLLLSVRAQEDLERLRIQL